MAEKSFNNFGYKTMKVMIFGDLALKVSLNINVGTIIALITPKPMKPTTEFGYSYIVDVET